MASWPILVSEWPSNLVLALRGMPRSLQRSAIWMRSRMINTKSATNDILLTDNILRLGFERVRCQEAHWDDVSLIACCM